MVIPEISSPESFIYFSSKIIKYSTPAMALLKYKPFTAQVATVLKSNELNNFL